MKLAESLKALVDAVNRTHHKGFFEFETPRAERTMPDFVTAVNGMQVNFEGESRRMAHEFAKTLVKSAPHEWSMIRFDALVQDLRKAVADLYVTGTFRANDDNWPAAVRQMRIELKRRIDERMRVTTYHFPAWTCRFEHSADLQLGPVIIRSRESWIRSVDFPDRAKEQHGGIVVNATWRESLIEALKGPCADANPIGVGLLLYDALVGVPP